MNLETNFCPICIDSFKNPLISKCGHSFCETCIHDSLKFHNNCPVCNATIEYDLLFPNLALQSLQKELELKTKNNLEQCKKKPIEPLNTEIMTEFLNLLEEQQVTQLKKITTEIEKLKRFKNILGIKTDLNLGSKRRATVDLTGKDEEKIKKVQDNFEELTDQFHLVENLDELTKTISTYTKLYRIKEIASFPDCEPLASGSKIISSIESNRNGDMFATAGVLKRINIYNLNNILYNENSNISKNYPISKIECDAKISCLSWNPFYENKLCSADYEGNLNVYDYLTGKLITSWTEHEKRCWSVDSSVLDPNRLISGSDDCKVKLWNQNNQKSIMTIDLKANVCSVRFSPKDSNLVAVGAADHRVLLFDLRKPSVPIFNSKEHYKSVSYVRFTESGSSLISASTDSTLRLWTQTGSLAWNPGKVMHGHLNQKNFVGLSNVYNDLIVTGTEENSIAIYNQNLESPVLNYSLRTKCPLTGTIMNDESGTFVSSVSWANRPDIDGNAVLLISNSTGNIRIVSVIQE